MSKNTETSNSGLPISQYLPHAYPVWYFVRETKAKN